MFVPRINISSCFISLKDKHLMLIKTLKKIFCKSRIRIKINLQLWLEEVIFRNQLQSNSDLIQNCSKTSSHVVWGESSCLHQENLQASLLESRPQTAGEEFWVALSLLAQNAKSLQLKVEEVYLGSQFLTFSSWFAGSEAETHDRRWTEGKVLSFWWTGSEIGWQNNYSISSSSPGSISCFLE